MSYSNLLILEGLLIGNYILQGDGADADPAGGNVPEADVPGLEGGAEAGGQRNAANTGLASGAQPPSDSNGPDTMVCIQSLCDDSG